MRRYPDPSKIIYPAGGPPTFVPRVTTRAPGRMYPMHDHIAFVNKSGEGVTDTVASHFHRVRGGRILPDQSDGHTHELTNLPAGAG